MMSHLLAATPAWHEVMVHRLLDGCVSLIVLGIFICGIRLVRGPHLADRALAVDTIAVHLVAVVVLLTMRLNLLLLIDGALVLSLLGFAGTVATAQFIVRRRARPTAARSVLDEASEEPLT